jgi:hypothetical protein
MASCYFHEPNQLSKLFSDREGEKSHEVQWVLSMSVLTPLSSASLPWKLHIGAASLKFFQPVFKMNFPKIADIALPRRCFRGYKKTIFLNVTY